MTRKSRKTRYLLPPNHPISKTPHRTVLEAYEAEPIIGITDPKFERRKLETLRAHYAKKRALPRDADEQARRTIMRADREKEAVGEALSLPNKEDGDRRMEADSRPPCRRSSSLHKGTVSPCFLDLISVWLRCVHPMVL